MPRKFFIVSFFVLLFGCSSVFADEVYKVAVIEFHNESDELLRKNLWTLAETLGKQLQDKSNDRVKAMKKKDVMKVLQELSWNEEDRLQLSQEAKLADSGVRYVVYGTVLQWRVKSSTRVKSRGTGHQHLPPIAYVAVSIQVLDPATQKVVKSFEVEGSSSAEVGRFDDFDPTDLDTTKYDEQFDDASDLALRSAAGIISEALFSK